MKRIIYLVIPFLLLGCEKSPEQKAKEEKIANEAKVESIVKSVLKDPESAQFQNIDGVCGEVNAKNSYGGYTGFKKFVISKKDERVLLEVSESDVDYWPFTHAWYEYCEKNK